MRADYGLAMLLIDDPSRFSGQPLKLRRAIASGFTDYQVIADGLTAGRILEVQRPSMYCSWLWTLTGPVCAEPGLNISTSGETESLDAAKTAFKASFTKWLSWAVEQAERGNASAWHGWQATGNKNASGRTNGRTD